MKRFDTRYVTLHFPLLHIDIGEREQYDKVVEEYNEFRFELFSESSPERVLHELQDLVQATLSWVYVLTKTTALDDKEADDKVRAFIEQENQNHRKKIARYMAERGWE
jgi:hypothetical protein